MKHWQKVFLGIVMGFASLPFVVMFLVWLDDRLNPISKYWDSASSPVQLDFMEKTKDFIDDGGNMAGNDDDADMRRPKAASPSLAVGK